MFKNLDFWHRFLIGFFAVLIADLVLSQFLPIEVRIVLLHIKFALIYVGLPIGCLIGLYLTRPRSQ